MHPHNNCAFCYRSTEFSTELVDIANKYVTLLHFRSKEFQRIHKPCIPHRRDTSKCTLLYIENVSRESGCTSKGQATIIKARIALMWDILLYFFYADPS